MFHNRHAIIQRLAGLLPPQTGWEQIVNQGRKAINASSETWNHESDLNISLAYDGLSISIQHTGFKKIDVSINLPLMIASCSRFIHQTDTKDVLVIAEQAVYSIIRLWVGHYEYCPYDLWRHQSLCRVAAKGGFGTTNITPQQRKLAEAVTSFFERSLVANIISRKEGISFTKGILYEHFINHHSHNLLTNIFFLSQLAVAQDAWQTVPVENQLPNDPLAEALMPEVLKPLFGLSIKRDRHSSRTILCQIHRNTSWSQRVYQLAELLIPYLCEVNERPGLEPYQSIGQNGLNVLDGQVQNLSDDGSQIEQMNNPFTSADENYPQPQASLQSGIPRPGRASLPIPRYNLEELDRYYSQRASAVIVETQSSDKKKQKEPELLQIGFLDSEEASISALITGQLDWLRTRCVCVNGKKRLKLFQRTEPLEVPLGSDEPATAGPPHLLLLVDSSGSMKFNPTTSLQGSRGKYDLVLLSCYGIFRYIEEKKKLTESVQIACINFSGRSIESGWHPFSSIDKVKTVLLTYQGGGTTLSPEAIRQAFQTRPGDFLAIAITDGGLSNTVEAASELKKVAESGCGDLILLHVGHPNAFTKAVEDLNCSVHILNSANDLVGLSLQVVKDRFEKPKR